MKILFLTPSMLILTIAIGFLASDVYAVCCFPWSMTHHVDPETGSLIVSGELYNDSYRQQPFGNTSYQFVFEDKDRNVLFEKYPILTDKLAVTGGAIIPYGVAFPFQIVIDDMDEDLIKKVTLVHTGSTETLDYFDWKPADLEVSLNSLENLQTFQSKITDDFFTTWKIDGTITNTHSEKTTNVFVSASLYDQYDRFIGVAGYSEEDVQPLTLDKHETKDFALFATIPKERIPDNAHLYAESDDSSTIYRDYMPIILRDTTDHDARKSDLQKPIILSANVTNHSRDNMDFEWIIQIKKSPKGLSERDVTKYPGSTVETIQHVPVHVDGQQTMPLTYSWTPQKDGIYFFEYFIWNDSRPLSYPFTGTFLRDPWMLVDSSDHSLKNQLFSGIPFDDLTCRFELELVQKAKTGNFACVDSESIPKLIERGWMYEE